MEVVNSNVPALPTVRTNRRPIVFWKLCGLILRDFLRSPWPIVNLLVLIGVHTLFFKYDSGQSHFFAIEYATIGLLAAINTAAIFSRAHRAETYAILARPVPRASFTGAMLLVSWLSAVVAHIVSTAADIIHFSPLLNAGATVQPWRNPTTYLISSIPVLVVALTVVGFVALLSSYVSTPEQRLGIFAAIAIFVMAFDPRNFPFEALQPIIQRIPPMLAPIAGALKYATDSTPDPVASFSLGALVAYSVVLAAIVLWLSTRRELILD